jgi:uncharacterized membrane protein YsdA (DUF1294 family)
MFQHKLQLLPLVVIMVFLPVSFYLGYTPLLITYIYLFFSLSSCLIYAIDKRAARKQKQRVAENTLHIFSILSGWPGAILAQQWLRHKTQKKSFRRLFWTTVLFNCGLLFWLHTAIGSIVLHALISALNHFVQQIIGGTILGKVILALTVFRT